MRHDHSRGYSLIELAIIIVIAGVTVLVGSSVFTQRNEQQRTISNESLMGAANQAIIGFIYSRERLPCPASSGSGEEDCSATFGELPWRALGMAAPLLNDAGFPLNYGHYSRPSASANLDAALAVARARYRPFYASSAPAIGSAQVLASVNAMDFCQALVVAENVPPSSDLLNISAADGNTFTNVPYVLINPGRNDSDGNGSRLDGLNAVMASAAPAVKSSVESPGREGSSTYDDRVYAAYFSQLSQELGCVGVMTPANSHANTLSAASVMTQAMRDYMVQLGFKKFLADADVVGATGGTIAVAADVAIIVAEASTSVSSTINSAGSLAGAIAAAAAAAILATAGGVQAAADLALAIATAVLANQNVNDFAALQQELELLHASIETQLINNIQAGLYD